MVMRYLRGTTNKGLMFAKGNVTCLNGYVDSDFAGSLDTRKSLSGYVFTLYGTAISWKSSLQSVVALSITEAEYIAMTEAVKEAVWLQGIIQELGFPQEKMTIYCDNQSVIHLTKHQMFHECSKHIDVKLHFVRNIIEEGTVEVKKISTEDNPADVFTKALPEGKFRHCLNLINCVE